MTTESTSSHEGSLKAGSAAADDDNPGEVSSTTPKEGSSFHDSFCFAGADSIKATSVPAAYEAFEYSALTDLGAIRIIEIEPNQDGAAIISCQLSHTNLASRPEYDTLSYVWGNQAETDDQQHSITLNGRKFFVRPNLWHAMHCLRHETETRTIWIDAICIEQANVQERNQQVSLMGDIYRTARQVFIWLGLEAESSHLAFERMHAAAAENHTDSFRNRSIHFEGRTLQAYEQLCRRPWFSRTWVLQEVALSKEATVLCGRDSIAFKHFMPKSSMLESFHPLEGQDAISHLDKMRGMRRGAGVSQILACAMFCHATEMRDRVYGLLGMLDDLNIQVHYDTDVKSVFQNFTRAIIQREGNLHILHQYGTQRLLPGLLTWVQDFSIMSPIGAITRGGHSIRGGFCEYILTETDGSTSVWNTSVYPNDIMPGMRFRGDSLTIRGKRLERVKAMGDELYADVEYAPGTDKFGEVLRGWEMVAAELMETKSFPHTVLQAFLETLTVEQTVIDSTAWDGMHKTMLWDWYRRYGTNALTKAENDHLKANECPALWPEVLDAETVDHSDVRYVYNKMTAMCYGRKLFVTYEGSMGLAAPRARVDDQVVFLPGGLYPFVLRPREDGTWPLMGDCYLYNFNVYKLFEDSQRPVEDFEIM